MVELFAGSLTSRREKLQERWLERADPNLLNVPRAGHPTPITAATFAEEREKVWFSDFKRSGGLIPVSVAICASMRLSTIRKIFSARDSSKRREAEVGPLVGTGRRRDLGSSIVRESPVHRFCADCVVPQFLACDTPGRLLAFSFALRNQRRRQSCNNVERSRKREAKRQTGFIPAILGGNTSKKGATV